jgi:hypothetical protein
MISGCGGTFWSVDTIAGINSCLVFCFFLEILKTWLGNALKRIVVDSFLEVKYSSGYYLSTLLVIYPRSSKEIYLNVIHKSIVYATRLFIQLPK